jgi:hypothetical protein
VFVLWGLYVMKNRRVLRHFTQHYERSAHKLMPPLTIGAAALSLWASLYGYQEAKLMPGSWHFWASIFGATTSSLSLVYGFYCMFTVWRMIRTGRGKLAAVPEFVRAWYFREHHADDAGAEFVTGALMESDFLEQMQRNSMRTEQRRQVAAAVGLLDIDPGDVTWHEDTPFAAGGFSTVWRVMYRGRVVAAKAIIRPPGAHSIRKAEQWLHGVKKEAAILHRLSACDNIVNVLGIFERPDGAVVLMEYASGGTLHDHLHGISMADMSTGTGTGASLTSGTAGAGGGCESLPPLEQAEQLSILIDVARAMVFCYMQDPSVQHRYGWF